MGVMVIINRTTRPLKLKVGNNLVFTDLATVEKNGRYKVDVDPNATFREYSLGADAWGNMLVVNADDCADNKTMTVKEMDGKFDVHTEESSPSKSSPSVAVAMAKACWKFWR